MGTTTLADCTPRQAPHGIWGSPSFVKRGCQKFTKYPLEQSPYPGNMSDASEMHRTYFSTKDDAYMVRQGAGSRVSLLPAQRWDSHSPPFTLVSLLKVIIPPFTLVSLLAV